MKTYIHEAIEVEKAGSEVNFHFSKPKQSKTRASRVEKWLQQILNGKGLND
ncbi:YdeI family protein [Desulfitobacterium sp. AusDCA]